MDNRDSWCEQLETVGLSTFSEKNREIMSKLVADGVPANYAVLTEIAAEAIIHAVAAMIDKNNQAVLTEIDCR